MEKNYDSNNELNDSDTNDSNISEDSKDGEAKEVVVIDLLIPAFKLSLDDEDDRDEVIEETKKRLGVKNTKIKLYKLSNSKDKKKRLETGHMAITVPKSSNKKIL